VPSDPGRRPIHDALAEERARLLPLPVHPFPSELVRPVASGKTLYIRFDLNHYSLPHELVHKPLTLVASNSIVRILDGDREVARHVRSYDRGEHVEDRAHIDALVQQKRHAHELRGRDRLRQACPHADAFIGALAVQGGNLGAATKRLLVLLDRFGAAALDAAISRRGARRGLLRRSRSSCRTIRRYAGCGSRRTRLQTTTS
jgi:hypothetical protein